MPTPLVGEDACVLYVREKDVKATPARVPGTTLADFMPWLDKADALRRGFGTYVLSQSGELAGDMRAFYFVRPRSPEESAIPYRVLSGIRQGLYWPPVLSEVVGTNLARSESDGTSYVDQVVWDFHFFNQAYRGPTSVREEWYASHEPFDIPPAVGLQDEGGVFDYGVGSVTLPSCLHGYLELTFATGPDNPHYPDQTFSKIFLPTYPTAWPSSLVLEDEQSFDPGSGLYIRKRLVALRPS